MKVKLRLYGKMYEKYKKQGLLGQEIFFLVYSKTGNGNSINKLAKCRQNMLAKNNFIRDCVLEIPLH